MEIDNRKKPSIEIELIPNGMKQVGVTSTGLPEFKYYGENAVIVKTTIYILAPASYYVQQSQSLASNISSIVNGGTNIKISVSMGGEFVKIKGGESFYSGTETFADYPTPASYSPPPAIESYSVDEGIIGYTINGDALFIGKSKGTTISTTVTASADPTGGAVAGTISGSHPGISSQLSSKSKSNGRVINGTEYYDYSYTYTTW